MVVERVGKYMVRERMFSFDGDNDDRFNFGAMGRRERKGRKGRKGRRERTPWSVKRLR